MQKLVVMVLVVMVLGSGCKRTTTYEGDRGGSPAGSVAPKPTVHTPAGPDFGALFKKIPNAKDRSDLAISHLTKAKEEYAKSKTLSGPEKKAAMDRCEDAWTKAGEIYDILKEEADRIHPKLWERTFQDFQKKWENLSSAEMKRALLTPR